MFIIDSTRGVFRPTLTPFDDSDFMSSRVIMEMNEGIKFVYVTLFHRIILLL